jgi:hypothetical protein
VRTILLLAVVSASFAGCSSDNAGQVPGAGGSAGAAGSSGGWAGTSTGGDSGADASLDALPAAATLRVAVLSDLNGSYGSTSYESTVSTAVAALIDQFSPDIVLSTGDLVAGQQAGLDYPAMWTAFHAAVTTPLTQAGLVFAPTPGNHDASGYASFSGERSA